MKTSHSSRGTFRACKRKYYWSYIQELEPDRKPKALRMGSAWSDILEHGIDALGEYYEPLFHSCPEWELGDLEHEYEILKALASTYPYYKSYVPESIAYKREVPFVHVGEGYEDRGQLDGLYPSGDRIVIEENKLFAQFGPKAVEMLEFDPQLDAYVTSLVDGDVEGYPDGVDLGLVDIDYNVTMKPALRKGAKETAKAFTERCVVDILKRPEHYHRQYHPTRTPDQLEDFRIRRNKHAMDLMYEEKMGVWERSPEACFDYGQCPFLKICRSHTSEEIPEGYRKKEERA